MYEKDVENLLNQMTSFYRDYLPMDSATARLVNTYIQSFLILWEEAKYLRQHVALETAPTLKLIKYAKVDIEEALYSKREALRIQRLSTLEEKLNELNRIGAYTMFVFNEVGSRTPVVYDMTLKQQFTGDESLLLYEDYFLRDNRLFLLPEFILKNERVVNTLHAFDIRVDNLMIERKWGLFFDIETGPLMARQKYRDVISAYQRLLSGNMSIRELKEAIQLATDWDGFNIQDMHSPNLRAGLRKLYDDWMISPAQFIVTIPEHLIQEKMELNVLLNMLDESKEEHINYLILFEILRHDKLGHHLSDPDKHFISMKQDDEALLEEKVAAKPIMRQRDFLFPMNRYDIGRRYDVRMNYDYNMLYQPLDMADDDQNPTHLDNGEHFDIPWKHKPEYAEVKHIEFPEIPRQFKMEKMDTGHLEFSVRPNTDGTEYFEVLGSPEKHGKYEALGIFSNDEGQAENIFIYDANDSANRYYKVRAISGLYVSLQTLSIHVDAV